MQALIKFFFVFLFACVRAFALLHFVLTGCATHKAFGVYPCLGWHDARKISCGLWFHLMRVPWLAGPLVLFRLVVSFLSHFLGKDYHI